MDPAETGGIADIWVGSNQKSIIADDQQSYSGDVHSVTDTTTSPRSTPMLQNTAPIDEYDVTSGATSESITTSHPGPNTVHQKHTSPALENGAAAVGHRGRDTLGKSHISISKATRSKSSSRDAPRDALRWESSFKSKEAPGSINSTASEDALSERCIINASRAENPPSASEETSTVLGSIFATGDSFYKDPKKTAMRESSKDTAASVTPAISSIPTIVLGDICNRKSVPAPGDSSNITSGEEAIDSSFYGEVTLFSATVDINGTRVTSSPEDYTTKVGDVSSFCDVLTSGTSPASDHGEISATTFEETSPPSPGSGIAFSGGSTANLFNAEEPVVTPAFSDISHPPSAVVSTNISLSLGGHSTTAGPGDGPTNGNKTETVPRKANISSSTASTSTSRDTHKASGDGSFNTSGNTSTTAPLEVDTTDSGKSVTVPGEEDMSPGSTPTTCLDTATIDEPFFILPGNVTNVVGIIDTTTGMFKNMATIYGNIPAAIVVETITIANPSEEMATTPFSRDVTETPISREEASPESENSVIAPSSINVCKNANTTGSTDIRDCGGDTVGDDSIATSPENASQAELLTSTSKSTSIISRENLSTSLKKTCGDSTGITPFVGSTPIPGGTKMAEAPGNTLATMVTMNQGSAIVSGDAVSTTFDKDTTFKCKASSDCLSDNSIPRNDTATMCTEKSCFLHDSAITTVATETLAASQDATLNVPGSVTVTTFSPDTAECSSETELGKSSEPIAVKTTIASGNITTTCKKTANTDAAVPTNISRNEPAREATTRNTTITLCNPCAPALQNTDVATPEEVTITKTSMVSRRATTIHSENPRTTVTTSIASEDTSITSADATPSTRKNTINNVSGDVSISMQSGAQGRNLNVSTIAGDIKAPSDDIMAVEDQNTGSSTNVSLLSTDMENDAAEDSNTNDMPGSLLINADKCIDTSIDTPEEMGYGERADSVFSDTTTNGGHMPTPSLSLSAGANIQEANTSLGDTTTAFGCTTQIPEGAYLAGTVNSVQSEMLLASEEASYRKTTISGHIVAETTVQSERNLTENPAGSSGDNKIWMEGTNKGPPVSSATSRTFEISEVTTSYEDARYTTATSALSVFPTGDNTIATSVDTNFISSFKEPTVTNDSGDVSLPTILGGDAITIISTTMGATATVTSHRDTVLATQAFPEAITTVSRNRSTSILQDTPKFGEMVTSGDIAVSSLRETSDVLTWETRSAADTHTLEESSDLAKIIPKDDLSSDLSDYTIMVAGSATTSNSNALSDTVSAPDNATSVSKMATSSDGIPISRDVPATTVSAKVQNQTTIAEGPTVVSEINSFATGENATTITQTVTGDATMDSVPEGTVTGNVTIFGSPENVANRTVSPRDVDGDASNPWDRTTLILEEIGKTPSFGNVINVTTPEATAHPHNFPPTEASTTSDNTVYGDTTGHPGASFIPSLDTISILGDTSKIPEKCIDNSITAAPLVDGTDLPVAIEDTSTPRCEDTSSITITEDLSTITLAPEATTIIPRGGSANEYRGVIATPVPEHISTTSGILGLSSADSTTALTGSQEITTNATLSEDIVSTDNTATARGYNASDTTAATATPLRDNRPTTEAASGEVASTNRGSPEKKGAFTKVSGPILENTSTKYEASSSNPRSHYGETPTSDTVAMPMTNLAPKVTFGKDCSNFVIHTGEMATEEIPDRGANVASKDSGGKSTSAFGGDTSFSEITTTSEGTVTSRQISVAAILEEAGIQKDTSGANSSLEEAYVIEVSPNSKMNLSCREDTSITPETTLAEDPILFPLRSGTTLSHSETTSLGKSTDLSLSTISSADPIARTFTNPTDEAHIFPRVISVPAPEGTGKETSTLGTALGTSEAYSSKATPPLEEGLILGETSVSEDTSTRVAAFDTGKSFTSDANSVLEKHSSSEAEATTTTFISASFPGIIDSTPCDSDILDETLTSEKVNTIEGHSRIPSSGETTSPGETFVFQDNVTGASGHSNTPGNIRNAPENSMTEDSIPVSGSNSAAQVDKSTLEKPNDTNSRESATISYIKRPTLKLREADTSTPTDVTMVPGESSTIPSAEATTSGMAMDNSPESDMSAEQNPATVSGHPSAAPGLILNASNGETNIAITEKTMDPTSRSVDPGMTQAISLGEVPDAATFGEGVDPTAETHKHSLAAAEVSLTEAPGGVGTPGNPTEATQRVICESTTVIHRKILPAVSGKTPNDATSGAFPSTALGEIPPAVSEDAADRCYSRRSPSAAPTDDASTASLICKKSPVVPPREVTSPSQGKSSIIKPVALLPYWSTLLIGMPVLLILALGLCMVIYYATFLILVTYSTL